MAFLRQFIRAHGRATLLLLATLALLVVIYTPTLLTEVSGGVEIKGQQDPYMQDVGEIQVALNVWGTIHHTGYPLFTILGNITASLLRAFGTTPAAAPVLFATLCGLLALAAFYSLLYRLTGKMEVAAAATLLLGVSRSIWVHEVIASVRSMSLLFMALLLLIALWSRIETAAQGRQRLWLLALLSGFGAAHHRSVSFMGIGLFAAIWPALRLQGRRVWAVIGVAVLLALIGFLPYLYLPARGFAHGVWVSGDPTTLQGFWREFTGTEEAGHLVHLPANSAAWVHDFVDTFAILSTDLSPVFAILGGIGLIWAMLRHKRKYEARIAALCSVGYFLWLFALHEVVIPEAIAMFIELVLALGVALGLDGIIDWLRSKVNMSVIGSVVSAVLSVIAVWVLVPAHYDYIHSLTHNDTGREMIALAKRVPRENGSAVLMMPWGPRYTAIGFSKYVTKENADLDLEMHTADFAALLKQGKRLYTYKDNFYRFPLAWWEERLGKVYLSSPAEELVSIQTAPTLRQDQNNASSMGFGVVRHEWQLCTTGQGLRLTVLWGAQKQPERDLSVFVKLWKGDTLLSQADSSAPVYGFYPTTRWTAGEAVQEVYSLFYQPQATDLTFGMYYQKATGEFVDVGVVKVPLTDVAACVNKPPALLGSRLTPSAKPANGIRVESPTGPQDQNTAF